MDGIKYTMLTLTKKKKKEVVAILISYRVDSEARKVIWDKEEHYIMIKGSLLQEDLTILNV